LEARSCTGICSKGKKVGRAPFHPRSIFSADFVQKINFLQENAGKNYI
jgi:hypothetical protein